jgi:hypothetical protein
MKFCVAQMSHQARCSAVLSPEGSFKNALYCIYVSMLCAILLSINVELLPLNSLVPELALMERLITAQQHYCT